MKIKKLQKIKNTGILQALNWNNLKPASKDENFEFKDINLIFGWNGTGKTTISRVLRTFELGEVCEKLKKYPDSEYEIICDDGKKLTQANISQENIRVFNKDFIEENIFQDFEQDGKNVNPIFYLGDKKIELTKERKRLDENRDELEKVNQEVDKLSGEKDKFAKDAAKNIKDILLGIKEFQFYDIRKFCDSYEALNQSVKENDKSLSDLRLNEQDFDSKLRLVKNTEALQRWIDDIEATSEKIDATMLDEVASLLTKVVSVQKSIGRLQQNWKISQWVQQGLVVHKEFKSASCEFCNQTIPEGRIQEIEQHFNQDYVELSSLVGSKINLLKELLINETEKIPDDSMKELAVRLNKSISSLIAELDSKQKDILSQRKLAADKKQEINKEISDIKRMVDERKKSFVGVGRELELSLISERYEDYTFILQSLSDRKNKKTELVKSISELEKQIKDTEKDIIDFKLPASEINGDLERFLGHTELKLVDHSDEYEEVSYLLKRGDEIAFNMSESEKTAISLIYFLRKLKENSFNSREGVIVIDDPISSMDSQFLYCAYAFIVTAIEDERATELKVSQLILLTHNFDLFNLFKKKYKKKIDKKKASVYMLKVELDNDQKRVSNIHPLDPLLEKFNSDYQYLFSRLKDFESSTESQKSDMAYIYNFPNIARRVLETFLSFRFPSKTDYKQKIDSATGSKADKESIYRFTNTQSHGTLREAETFSPEIIEPTAKDHILNILKLMKDTDPNHYAEMEKSLSL